MRAQTIPRMPRSVHVWRLVRNGRVAMSDFLAFTQMKTKVDLVVVNRASHEEHPVLCANPLV